MALLFMDSFDHYATGDILEKWTAVPGGVNDTSAIAAVGRHGSNGWKLACTSGNFSNASKVLQLVRTPADNTVVLGLAFNPVSPFATLDISTTLGLASPVLVVSYLGTDQCWIRVNTDGTLSAYRGTNFLGVTSAPLVQGAYTYVEILLTIHNTAGVVQIHFNGVSVLNLVTQNTRNGSANAWNQIQIGPAATNAFDQGVEWDIDDLYLLDGSGSAPLNTFLGDCRVDPRFPTGPGLSGTGANWTPSTGANYQCVDETLPNADSDYVSTTVVGTTDTHATQDAPVVGAVIFGVQHCLNMKKTDAGACSVAPVIRHVGVDYPGADLNPGTSYTYGLQVAPTNPGTGAAWTEAGFNAAEFGYRRTG